MARYQNRSRSDGASECEERNQVGADARRKQPGSPRHAEPPTRRSAVRGRRKDSMSMHDRVRREFLRRTGQDPVAVIVAVVMRADVGFEAFADVEASTKDGAPSKEAIADVVAKAIKGKEVQTQLDRVVDKILDNATNAVMKKLFGGSP